MSVTSSRPRYFWWGVALILLSGFGLRVWELGHTSLWLDEVVTASFTEGSLQQTWTYVSENAVHPPLHYIALHAFPRHNELLIRWPSVLAGMGGIAMLMFTAARLYGNLNLALMAGALLAFNPYHIWLSRMARVYSLLFTLCLINACFFLILLNGDRRRVNWLIFMISGTAAYLTHYFALFLPLTQYILFAFVLRRQRGFFRRWFRAQIVMGLPLGLWVLSLLLQGEVAVGVGWIPRPGLDDLAITLWNMTLGYDGTLHWYLIPGLIAAAAGLIPGLYYAWKERSTGRENLYWLWLMTAPLGLAFVFSVAVRPLYVDRYFVGFLPGILFLVLYGWQRAPYRAARGVLAGILIAASLTSVVDTFRNGKDEREDWYSATKYIEQNRLPEDGLLVEIPFQLLAVLYYWDNSTIDYAWLSGGPDETEDITQQYDAPVKRIWAVYRNPFDDGHRDSVMPDFDPFEPSDSPMSDWLIPRRDQIILQKEFKGVTLLLVDVEDELTAAGN